MTAAGHNGQLKSVVERIERIESELKELQKDRSEIYLEAKTNGFDPKIIRALIRERKLDAHQIAEREALLDSYRHALGMLSGTIFEDAARANVGTRA